MKSLYNSEKLYIETELGVKNNTVSLTVELKMKHREWVNTCSKTMFYLIVLTHLLNRL